MQILKQHGLPITLSLKMRLNASNDNYKVLIGATKNDYRTNRNNRRT